MTSIEATNVKAEALAKLNAGKPALVWRRRVADTETPVSAAIKLMQAERGDFILESVEGGETRGRHSLIGLAPDLIFRAQGNTAEINDRWQHDRSAFKDTPLPALEALRALAGQCRMDVPEELPSALACLVGYFGYEAVGLVEKLPRAPVSELDLPDMLFVRPTVIIVFDRLKDEMFLVAPVWPGDGVDAGKLLAAAEERLDLCEHDLSASPRHRSSQAKTRGEDHATPLHRSPRAKTRGPSGLTGVSSSLDTDGVALRPVLPEGRYSEMVLAAKEYIEAGDIFQVVLAQRFTAPFTLPPLDLYRALRRINPSPFLYFLDLPGFSVIGSSPEILVRVRDGEVTVRPIAGTRPRGKTASEDAANKASLLADPKERAEHLMLLDLGRNDVGRVARADSIKVTDSYMVEFYSHVMHIVSNVTGELSPDHDAIDALFAGFPAGTVSGAPKVAPARSSPNWNMKPVGRMRAASAISARMAIWIAASCYAPASSRMARSMCRQAQASSPIATPPTNRPNARPRLARCWPLRKRQCAWRMKRVLGSE